MVEINRVAKVVKGGRRFSFTALVVIGDEVDRVGVGYGKAREVPLAITKAVEDAKKNMFTVPKHGTTITHEVLGRFDAARVMLRPACEGTGVIAGGGVRAVLELGGDPQRAREEPRHDEPDQHGEGDGRRAAALRRPEDVARARGKTITEVLPYKHPEPSCAEPEPEAPAVAASALSKRMTTLKITQVRSQIGQSQRHRGTLRALGLGKIGKSVEHERARCSPVCSARSATS